MMCGGLWIRYAGALRAKRGVKKRNDQPLLLSYIGHLVCNHLIARAVGATTESKTRTPPRHIGEQNMLRSLPGLEALRPATASWLPALLYSGHSVFDSRHAARRQSARGSHERPRCARLVITVVTSWPLRRWPAGMVEGDGPCTVKDQRQFGRGARIFGILVAVLARHSPVGILPVELVLGGISASGGLLQRAFKLARPPGQVRKAFCSCDLASETYRGKVNWFSRLLAPGPKELSHDRRERAQRAWGVPLAVVGRRIASERAVSCS